MGTHPIFESDFDCLTDFEKNGMIFESDEMNECLSAVFVSKSL